MKQIMFNDWQDMALKKDIERIIRRMDSDNALFYSICWEVTITFAAIFVERLIDIDKIKLYMLISALILAVLPSLVIISFKSFTLFRRIWKSSNGILSIREFVDMFDNGISYWVMMSNSYGKILSKMHGEEEKIFIYQEGCYYNNKAMDELYRMKPVIDKVFSNAKERVKSKRLVEIQRLMNIQSLIIANQNKLDECMRQYEDRKPVMEQKELNAEYRKAFEEFVKDVQTCFGENAEVTTCV